MRTYLQRLGKSLMLPISVLPVVSLLFGTGYAINSTMWGKGSLLAGLLIKAGLAVIENIPMLFAVGIPVGLSRERDGVSALSGLTGFLLLQNILDPKNLPVMGKMDPAVFYAAFGKINNAFIGVLVGILVSVIYNRFSRTELVSVLSFFSGRRLVPILTVFFMILLSGVLYFVWPILYGGLLSLGTAISSLGALGAGIYGFLNRLLIPTGLHHALNAVFWFDTVNINDLGNFWSSQGVRGITGRYMAGYFPIMMFGLPGACLAMYHTAKPENQKKVGSMLLAISISALVVGLTEPIEFLFMFLSPLLYLIHALLTALSMFIAASMHWTAGFNFSAGLIDWVLSTQMPMANQPAMLLLLGLVMFILYYLVFRTLIIKLDIKTPGRGEGDVDFNDQGIGRIGIGTSASTEGLGKDEASALKIIEGLGGLGNLQAFDYCATRIRAEIKDAGKVDREAIKASGAANVMVLDKSNVQVIVGPRVQFIYDAMIRIKAAKDHDTHGSNETHESYETLGNRSNPSGMDI